MLENTQSEINIGLIGHVDHGKTTLTKALSGVWTDKHSEEIKRGISIRLGYADCDLYKCPKCPEPDAYTTEKKCGKCGGQAKFLRRISFVDSPGHETLMATMLSGAAIMDGAVLVIAANEQCPQPQTMEHLMALKILGIQKIVVAQNKIDLVSKEDAAKNHAQIKEFLKSNEINGVPIIPIVAHYKANIDVLIAAIQEFMPTPKRDLEKPARMHVARSFDINKPGAEVKEIKGGVLGGSLTQGILRVGDEIEVAPGFRKNKKFEPIKTRITSLIAGTAKLEEATPGGLIAIGTTLDPALAKGDNLSGNVLGEPGMLPPVKDALEVSVTLLNRAVGAEGKPKPLAKNESLMLSVGSAVTVGVVEDPGKAVLTLKLPVCAQTGDKIALNRRVGARWHLIGFGVVK
ncbi:MAG TPA: translation initiation factor IF-2 subunit gamma [Candidatus Altiarchaeales archaeon]|nr:translation initiation factor IF-2 subunit gamma [Candidatus Altiarchaeales archaeon]